MVRFASVLICPRQRLRRVQGVFEGFADSILSTAKIDLSRLEWADCREGTVVRMADCIPEATVVRLASQRLDCTALVCYTCNDEFWGYRLCYKGISEDVFETVPLAGRSDIPMGLYGGTPVAPAEPDQRTARLTRRFPGDRAALREYLVPWTQAELAGEGAPVRPSDSYPRGDCRQMEDFIKALVPWAGELLATGGLKPMEKKESAPSFPRQNAPDAGNSGAVRPREEEPGLETCLPLLASVRAVRRGWPFPLSLLYRLFPKKRPAPEDIPCQGWSARELEEVLEKFYTQKLDWLELDFTLQGKGNYIRRMNKTVYNPCRLTLELIREGGRCMCLFLDDGTCCAYQLIADRGPYMNVDCKLLEKTEFHGQTVNRYVVFQQPSPETVRREAAYLLARLDRRENALSPTARMGVWSYEGLQCTGVTEAAKKRFQQTRAGWMME